MWKIFVPLAFVAGVASTEVPALIEPARPSIAWLNRLDIHTVQIRPGETVLIGDSILELAAGVLPYRNHGLSGDTIQGVLSRIGPVLDSPAERIVIEVGINDLQRGEQPDPRPLMNALCASGNTVVWLQALPPNAVLNRREIMVRNRRVTMPTRAAVDAYNALVASLACPTVEFRPLPDLLEDGEIASRYTLDGLHLNGAGIAVLAEYIRQARS